MPLRTLVGAMTIVVCFAVTTSARAQCIGDCNGNNVVTVTEVVTGIDVALEVVPYASCSAFDANNDVKVTVDELVAGVHRALTGCPVPLSLDVEMNPDPVLPGEPLAMSLTVTNPSSLPALNVQIDAIVPSEVNDFSRLLTTATSCTSGNTCRAGDHIIWNVGDLAAGAGVSVNLAPAVRSGASAPAAGTMIDLSAVARIGTMQSTSATGSVVVRASRSFDLAVREDADPVPPGGTLTYSLTFGDTATASVLQNAALRMAVPAGTQFVSASDGGVLTDGMVEWTLGTFNPGQGGERTLVVQVDTAAAGTIIHAQAQIQDGAGLNDARATTQTRVQGRGPLELAMEVNPNPVRSNEALSVTLRVANSGLTDLPGVQLELPLPVEVNGFSVGLTGGATCPNLVDSALGCSPPERVTWALGTLKPGEGRSIAVPPIVGATIQGKVITFTAAVQDDAGDRRDATRAVRVRNDRVFDLAVHGDTDPVQPGGTLTYALTFGSSTTSVVAQNAVLRMPVPAGTQLVSASDGGVLNGSVVEWSLGTLSPGQSGERALVVQVENEVLDGTLIPAQAQIEDDAPFDRVRASTQTQVQSAVPLQLTLAVNPNPVRSNETLLVTMEVTNTGPVDLLGVQVELLMPVGISSTSVGVTGGATCPNIVDSALSCAPLERVTWALGTLKAGTGMPLALPPTVVATVQGSVINFTALASDDGGHQRQAERAVRVRSGRVFDLALHEDTNPVAPGQPLTYSLKFGNTATGTVAQNTVLRMPVPAGTVFVSAGDGGVLAGDVVEWSLGTLSPGDSGERQLVVQVADAAVDATVVRAHAQIDDANLFDRTTAATQTRVQSSVPLQLTMMVNPNPARTNETLLVSLDVTNTSAVDLLGVQVELLLPVGISSVSVGLTGGATCPNIVDSGLGCAPTERVTWALGTLKAGAGTTLALPPTVQATVQGSILNFTALAHDDSGNRREAARAVRVRSDRVFDLAVHEDLDPVQTDENLTYTLTFGNTTTGTIAQNTVLRMPVPVGADFVRVSDGGTIVSNVVEWNLGTLSPGDSGERTLVVSVRPEVMQGSILQAYAEIEDANAFDRTEAAAQTRVQNGGPLQLALEVNPNPARSNEIIQAALVATNTGSVDLLNVQVELLLPVGLRSTSVGQTGGATCPNIIDSALGCAPPERITWALDTLAVGNGTTLALPPTVAATVQGSILNFTALARDGASQRTNAARALRIRSGRTFDLAVRGDVDPVLPGQTLTYTATFGNATTGTVAQSTVLRMPIPVGTQLVSASSGGVLMDDGAVEWDLGTLSPGAGGAQQLMVKVADAAVAGTIIEAQAVIEDDAAFDRTGVSRSTRVHSGAPLQLTMSVNPTSALVGGAVQVSLTAKNAGSVALPLVQIELLLPAGINSIGVGATGGGTCPNIIDSALGCAPSERVTWALGTLAVGEERAVSVPPVVANSTRPGSVIVFDALASYPDDRSASASGALRVKLP